MFQYLYKKEQNIVAETTYALFFTFSIFFERKIIYTRQ